MNGMSLLDRDFTYGPYNKWDASMTYIWRLIPPIYIPVDYYKLNKKTLEGRALQPYEHPNYSWHKYDYENDYYDENDDGEQ